MLPVRLCLTILISVVYFDQQLGAAHSKPWLKYAFLTFLGLKAKKTKKCKNVEKTMREKLYSGDYCLACAAPKRWLKYTTNLLSSQKPYCFNDLRINSIINLNLNPFQ